MLSEIVVTFMHQWTDYLIHYGKVNTFSNSKYFVIWLSLTEQKGVFCYRKQPWDSNVSRLSSFSYKKGFY